MRARPEALVAGTAERDTPLNHDPIDARGDGAMKEIRCSEVGFFPECAGVMRGEDEEKVMAAAAEHGRTVHGMTDADFTDENVQVIRSHIRDA